MYYKSTCLTCKLLNCMFLHLWSSKLQRHQSMTMLLNVFYSSSNLLSSNSDGIEVSYNACGVLAHMMCDGPSAWTVDSPSRDAVMENMKQAITRWNLDSKRNINYRYQLNINYIKYQLQVSVKYQQQVLIEYFITELAKHFILLSRQTMYIEFSTNYTRKKCKQKLHIKLNEKRPINKNHQKSVSLI